MPYVNGLLLRKRRLERDEPTSAVAGAVGIAEGSLRNIESMRCRASLRLIHRLANHLGLNARDLLDVPDKPGDSAGLNALVELAKSKASE